MLKNILNLEGAQAITANEQKTIIGGNPIWCGYCRCEDGSLVHACGNASTTCYNACRNA